MSRLPSPGEFAALVAAYPQVPEMPDLVTAQQAARMADVTVSAVLEANRRARKARTEERWFPGLMPEPAADNPLRWTVQSLVEWRANPSQGKGGGHPLVEDDFPDLLEQLGDLAADVAPMPLSQVCVSTSLGISRKRAKRLLERWNAFRDPDRCPSCTYLLASSGHETACRLSFGPPGPLM